MFTGLVEGMGRVVRIHDLPPGIKLDLDCQQIGEEADIGDSISISGCCLTVVQRQGSELQFDLGEETLNRTHFRRLTVGSHVNLERSLRVGDRLGGHFVSGHVDTLGYLDRRLDDGQWSTLWFRVPPIWTRQMVSKGSIAIDGVSLTLVEVEEDRFSVALIPHTLEVTTLGPLRQGDPVNIETDLLAKYAQKAIQPDQDPAS